MKNSLVLPSLRLRFSFALIFCLLFGLGIRLFYIQIFQCLSYSEKAQRQSVRKVDIESYRGNILDRNGTLLATTVDGCSIYAHPKEIENMEKVFQMFRNVIPDFKEKISIKSDFVWLERKLDFLKSEEWIQRAPKGIGIVSEQKRYYPNGTLASHLIGSVGLDNRGLSGIEQKFDSFLRGKLMTVQRVRDGKGRNLAFQSEKSVSGFLVQEDWNKPSQKSIVLTIDRSLQYMAEKEIERGVKENRAQSGMIVMQNPKTGEILSMACYPNFNPNELVQGHCPENFSNNELQNPVVNKVFEPGSTFKIVAFCAALEENLVTQNDVIFCEDGKWKFMDVTINDHEPARNLTLSEVLQKSSNIGTAKIGLKIGKEKFYKYVRAFGFGTKTGLLLPSESEGTLKPPKNWSGVTLPNLSFGQGIGVTAIQMVNAFSSIANGGFLMEPTIVIETNDLNDKKRVKKSFSPQVIRRTVSRETAEIVKEMLCKVVESGTGDKAKLIGYRVAGKTGTAQKYDPKIRKYSPDKYVASFCGFAPADDPEIVCLVILDEPKKDYWGGSSAAPIFSRVVGRAMNILGVPARVPPVLLAKKN